MGGLGWLLGLLAAGCRAGTPAFPSTGVPIRRLGSFATLNLTCMHVSRRTLYAMDGQWTRKCARFSARILPPDPDETPLTGSTRFAHAWNPWAGPTCPRSSAGWSECRLNSPPVVCPLTIGRGDSRHRAARSCSALRSCCGPRPRRPRRAVRPGSSVAQSPCAVPPGSPPAQFPRAVPPGSSPGQFPRAVRLGRPPSLACESQDCSTARPRGADAIATGNARHFADCGVSIIDSRGAGQPG